jgi:hypothetical protein
MLKVEVDVVLAIVVNDTELRNCQDTMVRRRRVAPHRTIVY